MVRSKWMLFCLPLVMGMLLLPACNRKVGTATVKNDNPGPSVSPAPQAPAAQVPASPEMSTPPARPEPAPTPVALGLPTQLRDAYFDFDRSAIREDTKQFLQEDAKLLAGHPEMKVKIEGHCDERGTVEYNLALGNRRADAVKRYLISLGVEASRISIISYGKEKPFCDEHNEVCYQKNRRGHFVTLTAGR